MGFPDLPLGQRMHSFGVVLRSEGRKVEWLPFLHDVAKAIGMSPVAKPAIWSYPVDGKGGNGRTYVLPITESFLTLDTWPDHRGAYLFVCSCKPFDGFAIEAAAREIGLVPNENGNGRFYAELNLT